MSTTKEKVLSFIQKAYPNPISGQLISSELAISRTAVWKAIQRLKEEGYEIDSIGRSGYQFKEPPISKALLQEQLTTTLIGKELLVFPTISSTNTKAKELADQNLIGDGAVLISEEQTAARGRIGRTWNSLKGKTISLSIVLKPDLQPAKASLLTQLMAAAFINSLPESYSVKVKWPNDIVVNGKKLCGILTEMSSELTKIHYVVVGIGINTNLLVEDFPEDISSKATSLAILQNQKVEPNHLISQFLKEFETLYLNFIESEDPTPFLDSCRKASAVIGQDIYLLKGNERQLAHAVEIDDEGQLLVQLAGETDLTPVFAGEISIRGLDGYI
ncbi:biotin--[acetyl-CoA-carboxylase] ligase [Carnobacterium divergens]|uniref:biotin--[acetyl-CoA-carboxylase] ligase n=1 Tax=Carnobacterium divergens TaxID=2748 RepID=UPI002891D338|nr:biotin--[acetyl-CoA-carboxylase] ligase [Carnobacterium divergens]MDT2011016.1 biotin--[acetyl-CoA-carboxylase] ligase [Carnobacterium divergens]